MKTNIICGLVLILFIVVSSYTLGMLLYALYLLLTPEAVVHLSAVFGLFCAAIVGSDR
jgi:hypothetical protein